MSWLTYAARRTAFAGVAAFLVVTLTFLVVRTAPNTDLQAMAALMARGGASDAEIQAAIEQYRASHSLHGSLLDQYVRFVVDTATLDLGYSTAFRAEVAGLLGRAIPRTLGYVLPAVAIAYTIGILAGLASAYRGPVADWTLRVGGYTVFGASLVVVGAATATALQPHVSWISSPVWNTHPFIALGRPSFRGTEPWRSVGWKYVVPAAVLATGLVAGLLRHTRNNALAFRSSATSKMLAAKGADEAIDARHAVRNAALPLLSVSFAELMSVLALGAFVVETVFHIPGVAAYTMVAVYTRDYPLVVGSAIVFAFIGITGSLVQDLLYGYLDPRVGE